MGADPGNVPGQGADPATFAHATSEFEAVEQALAEAGERDLVLLPVHAERERVLELLQTRSARSSHTGSQSRLPGCLAVTGKAAYNLANELKTPQTQQQLSLAA